MLRKLYTFFFYLVVLMANAVLLTYAYTSTKVVFTEPSDPKELSVPIRVPDYTVVCLATFCVVVLLASFFVRSKTIKAAMYAAHLILFFFAMEL